MKNYYRKISNTIRTLVQYAPQTITGEPWENVSLAVQYAPVLCHPSPSPSMPSATSTKAVSCSVTGADKVTLIGSNCPASRVGQCVDCEGGCTAQIFSDCAITKYLSRATARRPPNNPNNSYCLASSTHSSPAELPWTSRNTGRPPTVASPVAHDRRLARRPVSRLLQR